ncbi:MAG: LysM peptidoglycan-binding domain-containing protein [Dysgonomonas sp.]
MKDTIKDTSIEVPQDIERNLEELIVDWRRSYKENPACSSRDGNDVLYPDSVYINRLYSLPTQMELAYNQIVRSYIDMYTSRKRSSVEYMLAKGYYYFPFFEETLDKYGLPLELKYLPVIESALNPVARSRAGATGIWQFMLRTGKMYGLEVNSLVDERRDPRKSTDAAARYLKDLYDIYGDWNLVIAAYNCGPGNVNKAIRRSGGEKDYWAIYSYLPRETRGYVPAFIAATYVMNYYDKHNLCPKEYIYPVSVDTVFVSQNVNLQQISEVLNLPLEELKELNPQYLKNVIPGYHKPYPLCLPTSIVGDFIVGLDSICSYKSNELLAHRKTVEVEDVIVSSNGKATKTHKIRRGESLGSIAQKYGVTIAHLRRMNNLKSNNIIAGRNLVIQRQTVVKKTAPPKAEEQVLASSSAAKPSPNNVQEKDNGSDNDFFAEYYKQKDVEIDSIQNNLDSISIAKIEEPEQKRTHFEDSRVIYHKVRIGETMLQIANKYDVSTKDILAWNKLRSKKVKIGQRLKIQLPQKKVETESNLAQEKKIPKVEKPQEKKIVYRVQKGDSLYLIAKKFNNVTAKDIMLANNLKSTRLDVGQKLSIPVN